MGVEAVMASQLTTDAKHSGTYPACDFEGFASEVVVAVVYLQRPLGATREAADDPVPVSVEIDPGDLHSVGHRLYSP
jgi:hypothetical protein